MLELDERWRALRAELETLRAEQNAASKGRKGPPTPEERDQLSKLAARGRDLSDTESAVQNHLTDYLTAIAELEAMVGAPFSSSQAPESKSPEKP